MFCRRVDRFSAVRQTMDLCLSPINQAVLTEFIRMPLASPRKFSYNSRSRKRRGVNFMTTIVANTQVTTGITIFTVAPENQQQLVDLIVRAAEEIAQSQPGFISINVHKSLDKTHVISYSQWENRQAFDEILQNTTVIPYVQQILKIATIKPNFYEVVAVIHSDNRAAS